MFPHCSQGGTLFAARILCIIPLLYILENTNQNKVGEDDHALTQKATEPSLRLSSFLFFFPSLRSSEGKRVSYSSYAVKYAICASQSMSEFWVNPHEYVTLSAWINKTCSLGNWGAAPLTNEDTICKWDFFFFFVSPPSPLLLIWPYAGFFLLHYQNHIDTLY